MRQCPFPDCEKIIPAERFACPTHWFSLSADHKKRIYAAYDAYKADEIGVEELRRRQNEVLAEHRASPPPAGTVTPREKPRTSAVPCKSCGAPIRWVRMASGKAMPVDSRVVPGKGNVRVKDGDGEVLHGDALRHAKANGIDLYLSHFATCVNAASHRKAK